MERYVPSPPFRLALRIARHISKDSNEEADRETIQTSYTLFRQRGGRGGVVGQESQQTSQIISYRCEGQHSARLDQGETGGADRVLQEISGTSGGATHSRSGSVACAKAG